MKNSIRPYLIEAVNLIKSNVSLLLIPTIITFAPYLFLFSFKNAPFTEMFFISSLFLFIIYPLIYGKFIAIINGDGSVGWRQLFVLHWWNYFVVKLLFSLPIMFFAFIFSLLNLEINHLIKTISWIMNIFAIYIIPLVFISHQKWPSILLGLKCLFGNFKFSLPLVLLSIFPILLALITMNSIILSMDPIYRVLSFLPQWVFTVLIDFAVFITASLIVKDKLYRE